MEIDEIDEFDLGDMVMIIYHNHCPDGWAAAAVSTIFEEKDGVCITYLPMTPDDVSIGVENLIKHVNKQTKIRIFDLCISHQDAWKLLNYFDDICILDHHKTTIDSFRENVPWINDGVEFKSGRKLFRYNNNKCGATLAWQFYCNNEEPPMFLQYIEDRDLWKWQLPNSTIICNGISYLYPMNYIVSAYPYLYTRVYPNEPNAICVNNKIPDFSKWINAINSHDNEIWIKEAYEHGKIMSYIINNNVIAAAKSAKVFRWKNMNVYFCCAGCVDQSTLGEYLYNRKRADDTYYCDYVFMWRYNHWNNKCSISLRSRKGSNMDISTIAREFGGGGHRHAAGFSCTMKTLTDIFNECSSVHEVHDLSNLFE